MKKSLVFLFFIVVLLLSACSDGKSDVNVSDTETVDSEDNVFVEARYDFAPKKMTIYDLAADGKTWIEVHRENFYYDEKGRLVSKINTSSWANENEDGEVEKGQFIEKLSYKYDVNDRFSSYESKSTHNDEFYLDTKYILEYEKGLLAGYRYEFKKAGDEKLDDGYVFVRRDEKDRFLYAIEDRQEEHKDEDDVSTFFSYDDENRSIEYVEKRRTKTTYYFDEKDRLLKSVSVDDDGEEVKEFLYTENSSALSTETLLSNNLAVEMDEKNHITKFSHVDKNSKTVIEYTTDGNSSFIEKGLPLSTFTSAIGQPVDSKWLLFYLDGRIQNDNI